MQVYVSRHTDCDIVGTSNTIGHNHLKNKTEKTSLLDFHQPAVYNFQQQWGWCIAAHSQVGMAVVKVVALRMLPCNQCGMHHDPPPLSLILLQLRWLTIVSFQILFLMNHTWLLFSVSLFGVHLNAANSTYQQALGVSQYLLFRLDRFAPCQVQRTSFGNWYMNWMLGTDFAFGHAARLFQAVSGCFTIQCWSASM